MCGIVGMAGQLEWRDKDALQMLLHFSELRGEDSTGIFTVTRTSDEASIIKTVGPTRTFFDTTAWDKLSLSTKRVVIGHTRKATIGAIKRSTAHPFNYGAFTGVHNGTLKNWKYLPGESEETDSMTLYDNFNRVGVRETIEATDGAYALIWWNEELGELNVLRNGERSLFYCFSEDFKRIFWASEAWMLSIALSKAGIKLGNLTPKDKTETFILPVETDSWWRIKVGGVGAKHALTFLNKADDTHDEELKGGVNPAKYVAPPFQAGRYQSPFPATPHVAPRPGVNLPALREASPAATGQAAASTTTNKPTSDTGTPASDSATRDSQASRPTLTVVQGSKNAGSDASNNDGLDVVVGYNGLVLEREEFRTLVDPNCIWCNKPVDFDDVIKDPTVIGDWTDEDSFVCSDCCSNTHGYVCGSFSS